MEKSKSKQILIALTAAIGLSIVGFFLISILVYLFDKNMNGILLGGDKRPILGGLLIGAPLGSLSGLYLCLKVKTTFNLILGFCFGMVGSVVVVYLLDILGSLAILTSPILVSIFVFVGYYGSTQFFRKGNISK